MGTNINTNAFDKKLLDNLKKSGLNTDFVDEGNVNHHWNDLQMLEIPMGARYESELDSALIPSVHSHSFYEIIFVESGSPQYLIGKERIQVQKGDLIVFPPYTSHQPLMGNVKSSSFTPYNRGIIWINPSYWDKEIVKHPELNYLFQYCQKVKTNVLRIPDVLAPELYELVRRIKEENLHEKFGWDVYCQIYVMQFIMTVNRILYYYDVPYPASEVEDFSDKVRLYVEQHLEEKITLDNVAKEFHVSNSTISHLFKCSISISFYQYVIQRRLLKAQKLLLSGTPVSEVYTYCGFSDYTAFFRAFKKEYGLSPTQYKNEFSKNSILFGEKWNRMEQSENRRF